MTNSFRILVPATTANLGPGFDCLGMALTLYNEIEVTVLTSGDYTPENVLIEIEGVGEAELPRDERNLIGYAMHRVFVRAGVQPPLFALKTINRIPLMSGLG